MNVSDLMTPQPITILSKATIAEALQKMRDRGCHHLPVLSREKHMTGILSFHDCQRVLGDALKRAGGTDGTKLRDAIAQTKDFPGVTGTITMNAQRNVDKPATVLDLKPRERKFDYKETIFPDGMTPPATGSPAATVAP